MSTSSYAGSERQHRNEDSRNHAEHDKEPWLGWEEEMLALWEGGEADLAELADMLGRTIEATRQRYYIVTRIGYIRTTIRRTKEATTVTVTTVTCSHCGLQHPGEC